MKVEFSPKAFHDLEAIGDFIAQDSPVNAAKFVNKLIDRCMDIARAPKGYIARPELGVDIRSVAFQDYLIFYTADQQSLRVERIIHGSRDYLSEDFH